MSIQDANDSDLVKIVKQAGAFRKNYGPLLGAWLFDRTVTKATGNRPVWWKWLIGVVIVLGGLWLKLG